MSLYRQLGGGEAIQVALDLFYGKVMADPRVSGFFDGMDMERIKLKQMAFLTMAFGGPDAYDGRTLRAAHRRPLEQGLDEKRFEIYMDLFRETLDELGVPDELAGQVMDVACGHRGDVLALAGGDGTPDRADSETPRRSRDLPAG